jgi:hypothetical protein
MLFAVPVSEQGVNVAEDDAALARAREVRERLVAGEPFARLAGEYSGAASRANGGLIGPFQTSELAPQLVELLAPMAVGDITEPIRTDRGYMILKLESRVGATLPPFEQVRSQITNQIGQGRIEREQERYLDRLRSQATIAWRNEELQKAYDTALAARRSGAEPSASAPAHSGLDRFVRMGKGEFIGREALQRQLDAGVPSRFVTVECHDVGDADPLGNEPLFDEGGAMIGRATSGYYGHVLGKSLAIGYVQAPFAAVGTRLQIEILGERRRATVLVDSPYDPENQDLKA